MDVFEIRSDYLINYEIEDGKIIENYFGDCPASIVPYTEHNRDILERKLAKQWSKFVSSAKYQNLLYKEKYMNICNKMFLGCAVVDFIIKPNNTLTYINLAAFGVTFFMLHRLNNDLKRPKVTEFCINNIDKVNAVISDPDVKDIISCSNCESFSLNNQHEFSTSDLCFIRNIVKLKELKK